MPFGSPRQAKCIPKRWELERATQSNAAAPVWLALALAACFWQSPSSEIFWFDLSLHGTSIAGKIMMSTGAHFREDLYHGRRCFSHGKELHSMEHAKSSAKLLGKTKHHGILWEDYGRLSCMQWCLMQMRVKEVLVSWGDVLADQKSRGESYWIWGMLFGSNVVSSIGLGSFKCIEMLLSVGLHWVSLCYTLFVSVQFIVMFDHNVRSIWTRPGTVLTMPVLPMILAQPTWAEAPLFCFW